ncbi:OTU domain-containing protein [Mesoterricola silvestris]|uniref:C2H2-type domain-containing protein n=1 Tax=Mesoterricola silvestris TaxID=2927979 RepID=A0AA48GGS0_9BACT|nr:OTU domain-containing protein [Mesoterricola silvestris]BDU70902.1 hypothetical protein METEAL_00760 [Mesoterricola silvestris]
MRAHPVFLAPLLALGGLSSRAETIHVTVENRHASAWWMIQQAPGPQGPAAPESKEPAPSPLWQSLPPGAITRVRLEGREGSDHLLLTLKSKAEDGAAPSRRRVRLPLPPPGGPAGGDPPRVVIGPDGGVNLLHAGAGVPPPPPAPAELSPGPGRPGTFFCRFCPHVLGTPSGIRRHERMKHGTATPAGTGGAPVPVAPARPLAPRPISLPVGRVIPAPPPSAGWVAVQDPAPPVASSGSIGSTLDWASVADLVRSRTSPASGSSASRKRGREPEADLGFTLPPAARGVLASSPELREAYLADLAGTAMFLGVVAGEILGDHLGVQAPILIQQEPLLGELPFLAEAASQVGTGTLPPAPARAIRFHGGHYSVLIPTPRDAAPEFTTASGRTFVETGEALPGDPEIRRVPADGNCLATSVFFLAHGRFPTGAEMRDLRQLVVARLRETPGKVDELVRDGMAVILHGAPPVFAGCFASWGPRFTRALLLRPEFASTYLEVASAPPGPPETASPL